MHTKLIVTADHEARAAEFNTAFGPRLHITAADVAQLDASKADMAARKASASDYEPAAVESPTVDYFAAAGVTAEDVAKFGGAA